MIAFYYAWESKVRDIGHVPPPGNHLDGFAVGGGYRWQRDGGSYHATIESAVAVKDTYTSCSMGTCKDHRLVKVTVETNNNKVLAVYPVEVLSRSNRQANAEAANA